LYLRKWIFAVAVLYVSLIFRVTQPSEVISFDGFFMLKKFFFNFFYKNIVIAIFSSKMNARILQVIKMLHEAKMCNRD
jgi:hypothetical protein